MTLNEIQIERILRSYMGYILTPKTIEKIKSEMVKLLKEEK